MADEEQVAALRDALTASGAGIYLCAHVAGPLPAETMAAVHASDELELRLGRVGPDRGDDLAQRDAEARAAFAAVMHVDPDRMVLTHGAPEAACLVLADVVTQAGPDRGPRTVVLVEGMADTVMAALADLAAATGSTVERVAGLDGSLPAEAILVAAAHMDRSGVMLDTERLASAARALGARTLLDTSLSCGAVDVDQGAMGLDAIIVEGHRWLLGPEAVAALWLSRDLGERTPARLRESVGSFGRGQLLGMARSAGWLLMYIGLPWSIARTTQLAGQLRRGIEAIDGVTVEGAGAASGPLVSFRVDGWRTEEAADELARRASAILDADVGEGVLRASVGAWLRPADIDRFLGAVRELAQQDASSVERRPPLTVLRGTEPRS